jgi:hypothetical protein
MSLPIQLRNNISIPPLDHLIQKKIIACHLHISDERNITTKPDISLLADRCVETPVAVLIEEFAERGGVAMELAVVVCKFVFAGEMKYVDRFPGIGKVVVVNCTLVSIELAIVVEYKELWSGFRRRKDGLCEFLSIEYKVRSDGLTNK